MVMYNGGFETSETPGLQDYLKAVQARKLLVLLFVLAGLGLAFLYTNNRTPSYEASTRVLVNPSPERAIAGPTKPNLETEREILTSESIARVVSSEVPGSPSPRDILKNLDVKFRTGSEVLSLTYSFTDPVVTAAVVNGFAQSYTAERIAGAAAVYDAERSTLTASADSLNTQIAALDESFARLNTALEALEPEDTAAAEALRSERTPLVTQRNQFTAELVNVERSLRALTQQEDGRSSAAEVLELADPPRAPQGFSNQLLWIVGSMLGLTTGIIAAFVADRLDTTAREESDVELALGKSVLGSVPPFGFGASRGKSELVMTSSDTSTRTQRAQESFRRLRTSIQFVANSDQIRSYLLTSSQPAEGKSTVAGNLSVALAQAGHTVVLVSADMRRPTIETLFGIRNTTGLSDFLESNTAGYPPVISVGIENLALIPSGPSPLKPGELLSSAQFKELIIQLEATYDFVIVDSPPVLSAADSAAAAINVGGVLVVVDSKRTDTEMLLRVRSDLERSGARIVGALLNKDRSRSTKFWSRRDRYAYERASAEVRR